MTINSEQIQALKAAAENATPGRIGDRIDGSGSIKYECVGYDGSTVLKTDHKNMEYGFVGDNGDADELFFRLCVPDVIRSLLTDRDADKALIAELQGIRAASEKLVRCKGRYHSEQNYLALAALFGVNTPDLPPLDGESRTLTVKLPERATADKYVDGTFDNSDLAAIYNTCRLECEVKIKNACAAAGITLKVGGE